MEATIEVDQPDGQTVFLCNKRCPLVGSKNIKAAQEWVQQPPGLEGEGTDVGIVDKNAALGCWSKNMRRVCQMMVENGLEA